MGNRIWLYGDSYAEDAEQSLKWLNKDTLDFDVLHNQWHRIIQRELNMEVVNNGACGTGLDYMYHVWAETRPHIRSGDVLIFAITERRRTWLIEQYPNVSVSWQMFEPGYEMSWIPRKQLQAAKAYHEHLYHGKERPALLNNFLWSVEGVVTNRNVRALFMPCFDDSVELIAPQKQQFSRDMHFADGHLFTISTGEFTEDVNATGWFDGRANHMSTRNHKVLAERIVKWYRTGADVNLKHGFHTNFYDRHMIDNPPPGTVGTRDPDYLRRMRKTFIPE